MRDHACRATSANTVGQSPGVRAGADSIAVWRNAAAIPGRIEAAHFDEGASGVAYSDTTSGNAGSVYRNTGVDLEAVAGGGYSVGWTEAGEWLTYSVNVANAGSYLASFRVGAAVAGKMTVGFNGNGAQATVDVPKTGGTQTWATVSVPLTLSAGNQVMRVGFTSAGVGFRSVSVNRVGATLTVKSGSSLQAALDAAKPGDTILLQAGATFTGNFVLPKKAGKATPTSRSGVPPLTRAFRGKACASRRPM